MTNMKKLNNHLANVVGLLQDGDYHDGTSMGAMLGMTRSAVWKTIKKLQQYNVPIDSIKGKGYALKESFILLDAIKIKQQVKKNDIDIVVLEQIDSTNH